MGSEHIYCALKGFRLLLRGVSGSSVQGLGFTVISDGG